MAMPKKIWCALVCVAMLGWACAPHTNSDLDFDEPAVEGRAVAKDLCAGCHAIDGKDESPLAAAPPFRTVLSKYKSDDLVSRLQSGELMNHPDLPSVYLSDRSAQALIAYLETLGEE